VRFLRPDLVRWWQLLPLLIGCWAVRYHYLRSLRRGIRVAPRFARLSRRSGQGREVAVLGVGLLAAGALVAGLLRPQALLAARIPELERQDLVLILDRSASMPAHDVSPSRFSRATLEIRNFLQHKPEAIDRVGLVSFADSSLILSYLTGDLDNISFYLDWIDRDTQSLLGTDIGAALKSAREVAKKDGRPTQKLFLLLSDGEDYGAELDRQLDAYRADGYRIHCVGIGSEEDVPVPLVQPDGREAPLRDEGGQPVKTHYAEATLRRVATSTGGRYLRSTTGGELARAMADIVRGERKITGWRTTMAYRDLYPACLAVTAAASAALWLLL
jgi:Ca-activated chloride channel family protein